MSAMKIIVLFITCLDSLNPRTLCIESFNMAAMKIIVLFITCLGILCGCAMQQDVIALYDRTTVLEQHSA
jgi:hypothetical protein